MGNEDEGSGKNQSLVNIQDLLGVGEASTTLIKALERGLGRWLASGQSRRDTRADIDNAKQWLELSKEMELGPIDAELNLSKRATIRLTDETIRHQENRETVARHALEDFRHSGAKEQEQDQEVDLEFLDLFWQLAERISTPNKQELWGRILSRKVGGKSSISARTLLFLSTLSLDEMKDLEQLAKFVYRFDRIDGSIGICITSHFHPGHHDLGSLTGEPQNLCLAPKFGPLIWDFSTKVSGTGGRWFRA